MVRFWCGAQSGSANGLPGRHWPVVERSGQRDPDVPGSLQHVKEPVALAAERRVPLGRLTWEWRQWPVWAAAVCRGAW